MNKLNQYLFQFIKIGSGCLFDDNGEMNYRVLKSRAAEIEDSKDNNVLVVSGAIALGMYKEKDVRKKEELSASELQGYATVGQIYLMEFYRSLFNRNVAQVLVTLDDLQKSNCIQNLLLENFKRKRITLINYNDGVDFEELRKDNDTLAAEIMLYCNGGRLVILGKDYDGFRDNNGNIIGRVYSVDNTLYEYCKGKSNCGNGGFKTKLDAARKILEHQREMIVSNICFNLEDIISGRVRRTLFKA